jgi:hypothetical protein
VNKLAFGHNYNNEKDIVSLIIKKVINEDYDLKTIVSFPNTGGLKVSL